MQVRFFSSVVAQSIILASLVSFVPRANATEVSPVPVQMVWSPDGTKAAFTIETNQDDGEYCPTELYELDLDSRVLQRLMQASVGTHPEEDFSCFYDVKFSPDGNFIYFLTPAWATSGAIHAISRRTGELSFVVDGGPYLVIGSGPLKGHLLVMRRKYPDDIDQGAYEEVDLIDPTDGTAIIQPEALHDVLKETVGLGSAQALLKRREGWLSW